MTTSHTCSWCGESAVSHGGAVTCPACGHRADLPRVDCTCRFCRRRQALAALVAAVSNDGLWELQIDRFRDVLRADGC